MLQIISVCTFFLHIMWALFKLPTHVLLDVKAISHQMAHFSFAMDTRLIFIAALWKFLEGQKDTAVDICRTCITMLLISQCKKKWQEMQLLRNFNFNELQLHQQRVIAKLSWNFADFITMRDSIVQLNASWRWLVHYFYKTYQKFP